MDIIQFEPFVEKRPRPGDTEGKYGYVETEIFEIPEDYYYKLGYRKENSDETNTKISYRRKFYNCLEEKHEFKLPFTEEEKTIIAKKLGPNIFLAKRIIGSHDEEFVFKSPFKTEHLIRGKTQNNLNVNRIFENIRDPSKYTFLFKFNKMTPSDVVKVNKTSLHKEMKKIDIEKLSKGSFKYIVRTYSLDTFYEHIERLEKAKSLFTAEEIEKAKSKLFCYFNFLFISRF